MSEPREAAGSPRIAIVGAGPAGLAAAWELARLGLNAVVHEKDTLVGGISRTVEYRGYRFDLGGHRFFTKVAEVQRQWEEILGDDFLERPRLSRIHYRDRFFDYPLRPVNALAGLGFVEALRIVASYGWAKLRPEPEEQSFEQWVTNRFGRRLYEIFFRTYTEKVWGLPCSEISADWAAQRIRNLNLLRAVRQALLGGTGDAVVTTLINRFHYPRLGPGMLWESCAAQLKARGTPTRLGEELVAVEHRGGRVVAITLAHDDGSRERRDVDQLIASLPIGALIGMLDPPPPAEVLAAARGLKHRDFLTVVLIVDVAELFPDNWIYIHSPEVRVGRIQNFKNWSPEMVPDPSRTALGLEYFANRGEPLWRTPDAELVALATGELERLGFATSAQVVDGTVVRVPNAYPVYDDGYRERLATLRDYLAGLTNLQMVGRNGQHRYNNQDHSMLTGIFAARNVVAPQHDVWDVNVEGEYHEESASAGGRAAPQPVVEPTFANLVARAFARYDAVALGLAAGATSAASLGLATAVSLLRQGEARGPTLSLLGVYLFGYDVTWPGVLVGLFEAGILGFAVGAMIGGAMNLVIGAVETSFRREIESEAAIDPMHGATP